MSACRSRRKVVRHERTRYGPGWEDRVDRWLNRRNEEKALALRRSPVLTGLLPEDVVMIATRLLELTRVELRGNDRHRFIGGPPDLQEITRRINARPEASLACRCHCAEPRGDGWAEE